MTQVLEARQAFDAARVEATAMVARKRALLGLAMIRAREKGSESQASIARSLGIVTEQVRRYDIDLSSETALLKPLYLYGAWNAVCRLAYTLRQQPPASYTDLMEAVTIMRMNRHWVTTVLLATLLVLLLPARLEAIYLRALSLLASWGFGVLSILVLLFCHQMGWLRRGPGIVTSSSTAC